MEAPNPRPDLRSHPRAFEALKVIPIGELGHDDLEWLTHPAGLRTSPRTWGLVVLFGSGFATAGPISSADVTHHALKTIATNSPGALLDPSVGLPLGINAQGPPGKASLQLGAVGLLARRVTVPVVPPSQPAVAAAAAAATTRSTRIARSQEDEEELRGCEASIVAFLQKVTTMYAVKFIQRRWKYLLASSDCTTTGIQTTQLCQ